MTTDLVVRAVKQNDRLDATWAGLEGELSAKSIPMYRRAVDDFLAFAQESGSHAGSLASVFSAYLKHLKDQGLAISTVKIKRIQIRRFFEWGARVGLIDQKQYYDLLQVKAPKAQGGKAGTWLTPAQMQMLLDAPDVSTAIGRRDRAMFALMLGCGLRRSEVCALTWAHLVQVGGVWVIRNLARKHNRMQAYIPVPDWVMRVILDYAPRGEDTAKVIVSIDRHGNWSDSIGDRAIWGILREYAARLGFGRLAPHDLRRSFARAAKAGGLSLSQLAMSLGHESVVTTEKYVNEEIDMLAISQAVELVV